ncbi:MAG: glycosyltransferase family 39 protein [Candidatus Didemnitutus sp.]|nr:glycosyltransferase family 39 protein [Candidatus Didemnitutus sp.]
MPARVRSLFSLLAGRNLSPWLATVALAGYALFAWNNAGIVPGGADTSGYFNLARLLSQGATHVAPRSIEGLPLNTVPFHSYTPLGFHPTKDRTALVPTYPLGLPVFFAASAKLFGWSIGPLLVMVLHAVAGIGLVYLLAREAGLSSGLAALGALALAVSPLYVQFLVQAMSDVPALVWCAAALWCAFRTSRWSALGCGAALGIAVLVRPTNLLIMLPIALVLGRAWRRWLLVGLGGVPFAALLFQFNHLAYGQAFASGYGQVKMLFSFEWVGLTLAHYAQWLPVVLSPLVLAVLGLPWIWRRAHQPVLVHATSVFVFLGFYAFYFHTHETWWYLRFVLPAFPSLIVLMLLVGRHWLERLPSGNWQRTAWMLGTLVIALNGWAWSRHFNAVGIGRGEMIYARLIEPMRHEVPSNAVIVTMQASGALFYSTDYVLLRWDMIEQAWPQLRDGARAAGRPIYALLWEYELKGALADRVPGKWRKISELAPGSLWRLDPED